MDRILANARFEEQDAGSGPVYSSPTVGPVSTAVHNISGRHLHDIGVSLPDDRQFLRAWRRQLQDCLSGQHNRMIKFLLADISGDPRQILSKYSRPTWNFASSTQDLSLNIDCDKTNAEIAEELDGFSPKDLRELQKKVVRLYVSAAAATCSAEERLEEKLKRIDHVETKISELMNMESTEELEELAGPTRAYLDSVLSKINIEEDYAELIRSYKKFAALKGLVSLQNIQRAAAPTCTICMTKEVSHVIAPCGHTFCEECCRTQMTACYICRVQVRDRMRLYFS